MPIKAIVLGMILLIVAACGPAPTPTAVPTATIDVGATATAVGGAAQAQQTEVARQVAAALTAAAPTATFTPTQTRTPTTTHTPAPTHTATSVPPTATVTPVPKVAFSRAPINIEGRWDVSLQEIRRDATIWYGSIPQNADGVFVTLIFRVKNLQSSSANWGSQYEAWVVDDRNRMTKSARGAMNNYAAVQTYCPDRCSVFYGMVQKGAEALVLDTYDVAEEARKLTVNITFPAGARAIGTIIVDNVTAVPPFRR